MATTIRIDQIGINAGSVSFAEIAFLDSAGAVLAISAATAVSTYSAAYDITKSYDGNVATFYASGGAPSAEVLTYTLPAGVSVAKVSITSRNDDASTAGNQTPHTFRLSASSDGGANYTVVGTATYAAWAAGQTQSVALTVATPPTIVRLDQFNINAGSVSFAEIEFHATAGGAALPISAATAVSAYSAAYDITKSYDGNLATLYSSAGAPSAEALTYTLPSGSSVAEVKLTARNDDASTAGNQTPHSFRLSTSSDNGATYTVVGTATYANWSVGQTQSAAIAAPLAMKTITVDSPAFKFAPGVWAGDTGRGGSAWRRTWRNGATFDFAWTASADPRATIMLPSSSASNRVSYYLNGTLVDDIAANAPIPITGITPSASNRLTVLLRNSDQSARWNGGTNNVQVLGMSIDTGSAAGTAPAARPWMLLAGDSITEGIGANSAEASWANALRKALDAAGYDLGVDACGYSDFDLGGDASRDVPGWYSVIGGTYDAASRWNKVDSGVSRLDANGRLSSYGATGTEPAMVLTNLGTNVALVAGSDADLRASITAHCVAVRAVAPNATIGIIMPFGMRSSPKYDAKYPTAIAGGVNDYLNAHPTDLRVVLLDNSVAFANAFQAAPNITGDTTHPTAAGQTYAAAFVDPLIIANIVPRWPLNTALFTIAGFPAGAAIALTGDAIDRGYIVGDPANSLRPKRGPTTPPLDAMVNGQPDPAIKFTATGTLTGYAPTAANFAVHVINLSAAAPAPSLSIGSVSLSG